MSLGSSVALFRSQVATKADKTGATEKLYFDMNTA